MTLIRKKNLESSEKHLVEMMQDLNFGRIIGLHTRGGRPSFNPPPKVLREIKFGGENGPRPELKSRDFTLKSQTIALLENLSHLGDGITVTIEVRHGLPFGMSYEETIRA